MLIVRRRTITSQDKSQFEIQDHHDEGEGYTAVTVHPWHRYKGTGRESAAVYVSVGDYNGDGTEQEGPVRNIIVDRQMFVAGLLETFPELKRANE